MLVFLKEKLVIFSVPKTGTTALEAVLAPHADMAITNPPVLKHMPCYRYNRFMQPLMEVVGAPDIEGFAMVREPIDRLASWYKYRSRPDTLNTPNSTEHVTFDEFVNESMKGKPLPHAHIGTQARFLMANTDTVMVEHLYQYEQMDLALEFLQNRLGREITLPQLNVSPKRTIELRPKTEEKLRRKRADEFALWEGARR